MKSQQMFDDSDDGPSTKKMKKKEDGKGSSDFENEDISDEDDSIFPNNKKRRLAMEHDKGVAKTILGSTIVQLGQDVNLEQAACMPPARRHNGAYHTSLMLGLAHGRPTRTRLLSWFDTVSASRAMPWRKPWLDPEKYVGKDSEFRQLLAKRAYEVWISEIMLQQTRVAVVIDYWNRWTARWPTIEDLARAEQDEVVSAWRGLGYYSRATRIHEAAKQVVNDKHLKGLLPATAQDLQAKVPGVGRYTGGAISAIVFGHAAPMVDGNVLRVLSRQLGLLGNVKTNKKVIDFLWSSADALVRAVADDVDEGEQVGRLSDRPGRWGQALMELGSTVCTPKPDCSVCPITSSCRAYAEGSLLAKKKNLLITSVKEEHTSSTAVTDIEDLCNLCEPYEENSLDAEDEVGGTATGSDAVTTGMNAKKTKAKQATLSSFAFTKKESPYQSINQKPSTVTSAKALEVIVEHAKRFPVKVVKKAVREEETVVCAVRSTDDRYLLYKRPEKGE
jgi:A/G-specific adenine glycosylase